MEKISHNILKKGYQTILEAPKNRDLVLANMVNAITEALEDPLNQLQLNDGSRQLLTNLNDLTIKKLFLRKPFSSIGAQPSQIYEENMIKPINDKIISISQKIEEKYTHIHNFLEKKNMELKMNLIEEITSGN